MSKRIRQVKPRPSNLDELVFEWTSESGDNLGLHAKLSLLKLLGDCLYSQYQPFPEKPNYTDRLFAWIDQVSSVYDKKILFELAIWLLFVGSEEMISLYRSSHAGIVTRWVIDQANIDITLPSAAAEIELALKATFFGSIAGMDMGAYCRANAIQQSYRPDFREVGKIGDVAKLQQYLHSEGYKRVVAVEDYVGSGTQMRQAWTCLGQLNAFPLLVSPIIVADSGAKVGRQLTSAPNSWFQPVLATPPESAVPRFVRVGFREHAFNKRVRSLLLRVWNKTEGNIPTQPLYGPFGCGGVGSLVLTYLNCPDNVPPAIHHTSDQWRPLFERAPRKV